MWNIIKNVVLDNIEISDCNDTVNGYCADTQNLQDCMNICKNNDCKVGYFIKGENRNYCVPLVHHSQTITSPYYRIMNKNNYEELRNKESLGKERKKN